MTKYTEEGEIINDVNATVNLNSIRANEYDWTNNIMDLKSDRIDFDTLELNASKSVSIAVTNNLIEDRKLNYFSSLKDLIKASADFWSHNE